MLKFDFDTDRRRQLIAHTVRALEDYYQNTKRHQVAPLLDLQEVRSYIRSYAGSTSDDTSILDHVMHGLSSYAVHTPHPAYFGLFNPRPAFPGILADLMTATFNPQLAAWSHSPFAYEVERYLIAEIGERYGYPTVDGTFCSGGAEANQTAVLCALNRAFPTYLSSGLRGLDKQPVLYCSADAHHSVAKAARMCGLGIDAVRNIPMDKDLRMNSDALASQVEADIESGFQPFMVVATAGTTGPGAIDPLEEIGALAARHDLWYHVDGAFGGALALHPDGVTLLKGIALSDSVTFDIHKWLAAPMGTSTFITRHQDILSSTFRITAEYMPKDGAGIDAEDPYTHSIQWSRRSLGLRMYMSLLFFGWDGYASLIEHHMEMGRQLEALLLDHGWSIENRTALPITCFRDDSLSAEAVDYIVQHVNHSGKAWISQYPIHGEPCIRACITNYATSSVELQELVALLHAARRDCLSQHRVAE